MTHRKKLAEIIVLLFVLGIFSPSWSLATPNRLKLPKKCQEKLPQKDAQGRKTGPEWHCYPNGRWKSVLNWAYGEQTGISIDWYPNGRTRTIYHWWRGLQDGVFLGWDEKGRLLWKGHFVKGQLQGKMTRWFPNGQKLWEGYFVNGKLTGPSTRWHPNGQKAMTYTWIEGFICGNVRAWDEKGRPTSAPITDDLLLSQCKKTPTGARCYPCPKKRRKKKYKSLAAKISGMIRDIVNPQNPAAPSNSEQNLSPESQPSIKVIPYAPSKKKKKPTLPKKSPSKTQKLLQKQRNSTTKHSEK